MAQVNVWDIDELVEDAIVSYLKEKISSGMRAYAAWGFDEPQFPAVVVFSGETNPVVENATWDNNRQMPVRVAVMTEAKPQKSALTGKIIRTPREINRIARSTVMAALAREDLPAQLNCQEIDNINFSMAQVRDWNRDVEEKRTLVTNIILEVIANTYDDA